MKAWVKYSSLLLLLLFSIFVNVVGLTIHNYTGVSMCPARSPRGLSLQLNSDSYSLGDVVVFDVNGKLIGHRIVGKGIDFNLIEGDYCKFARKSGLGCKQHQLADNQILSREIFHIDFATCPDLNVSKQELTALIEKFK